MTALAPTIMTAVRHAMASIDRVARFTDPATTKLSHTEQFQAPDGRWWSLTLQPVEARSALIPGE